MKVKELLEYLQACDPEAEVKYDAEWAIRNNEYVVYDDMGEEVDPTELNFKVENILRLTNAQGRKRVYLSEGDAE